MTNDIVAYKEYLRDMRANDAIEKLVDYIEVLNESIQELELQVETLQERIANCENSAA